MNEQKLKELVAQTDIKLVMTEFSGCLKGQDYLVTDQNLTEMQLKQFAELIVRECAQEAYDCAKQFRNDEHYSADNLWPHFERVCNAVGDDIKIKFGVEK